MTVMEVLEENISRCNLELDHQKKLHEELFTPTPTQLRMYSLLKISRQIDRIEKNIEAYNLVVEDIIIEDERIAS